MKEVSFAALDASADQWNVTWAHTWISFAAQMEGSVAEAEEHLNMAVDLLGPTRDYWMAYWIHLLRYRFAFEQGDISWSRQILEEVLVNLRTIDWRRGIQYSLQLLYIVSMALEDYAAAQGYLMESLHVIEEIGAVREKVAVLVDLAAALAADGQPEGALEMAATAFAHPLSYQNTGWNMDPISSRAEEIKRSLEGVLDPAKAAAAWNRGLAANFDSVVAILIETGAREHDWVSR
jgi:tetratricopeptide (TPR) repeat protein